MNLKPLNDQILVKPFHKESKIALPATLDRKPRTGRVLAIGNKVTAVKEEQMVLFNEFSPSEIKVENRVLLIIKEEDILAVLSED